MAEITSARDKTAHEDFVVSPKSKLRRDSFERRKSATTTTTTDDSESGSRKSSMSSGKQQQQQPQKQFAVTFFVSENDKTKLVDIIHRAKTVIAKKVDKVMGRKGDKAGGGSGQGATHSASGSRRSSGSAGQAAGKEPTSALAITTILENWVSQEEEKGREEEVEVAELIEDQKAQGRDSCSFDELFSVILKMRIGKITRPKGDG